MAPSFEQFCQPMSRRLLLRFIYLLSLQIVCSKYDRTNDLFDFYAGNPLGLRVFSVLKTVISPMPPMQLPSSLHVIYAGDCADFDEDMRAWPISMFSYQCLRNDEDIDTCRYSLQADDRDLDFVRDTSCANAIISRSEVVAVSSSSNAPDQGVTRILLIPFHCGCHDTLHPVRVAMQVLYEFERRHGAFPALIFAFNCDVPGSISLISSRIDAQLRRDLPFIADHASPWLMLSGHCDWAAQDLGILESNQPAKNHHTGNCSEQGIQSHPNALATIFDAQMLRLLSPCCMHAIEPKLSLSPSNGSVIYCDVPFPMKFSWLHHSELQPLAFSHRFNAGILEFRSRYLTTENTFRLQLSQETTTVLLKCSDVDPHAPLLVPLEVYFESFSTSDDVDGDKYKLSYTLATPCSMPLAHIPAQHLAALRDAAIFTWDESDGSTRPPPVLHVCSA